MYEDFASTYDLFDGDNVDAAINLVLSQHLPPAQHILDFGSGTGRIAMELLRRNFNVDCYEPCEAMRAAMFSRLHLFRDTLSRLRIFSSETTLLSIRNIGLVLSRDVFFLLDKDELLRTLAVIRSILPSRGRFIVNFLNKNCDRAQRKSFEQTIMTGDTKWCRRTYIEKISDEELKVLWELDLRSSGNGIAREYYRVRLHSLEEFASILKKTGFELIASFADYNGIAFEKKDSQGCVVIAARS